MPSSVRLGALILLSCNPLSSTHVVEMLKPAEPPLRNWVGEGLALDLRYQKIHLETGHYKKSLCVEAAQYLRGKKGAGQNKKTITHVCKIVLWELIGNVTPDAMS